MKAMDVNPYITNWIISFLTKRQQRVVVDGKSTEFASFNRGVPQGTVLGPILFSIMINDITAVHPGSNLLLKYADDLTFSVPVKSTVPNSLAMQEVGNIQQWACKSRMKLNLSKTWEILLRGKTTKQVPDALPSIVGKPAEL